ncbi:hypothetical protein J437_LFUL002232 [Ladona fulva]|uniref:Reverse transcriptase domain-containing protein n=1 Tax=Ladona fulva TaxID=123851 RepID=A0A8K0JZH1_LADFU|nr:hypothetical protein J437_LFUL002232 [Ladona fulva]
MLSLKPVVILDLSLWTQWFHRPKFSLLDAAKAILHLGLDIHLAKLDLQSAFHQIPIGTPPVLWGFHQRQMLPVLPPANGAHIGTGHHPKKNLPIISIGGEHFAPAPLHRISACYAEEEAGSRTRYRAYGFGRKSYVKVQSSSIAAACVLAAKVTVSDSHRKMEVEQQGNIKFCVKLGKSPCEMYIMMKSVYGSDRLSQTNVFGVQYSTLSLSSGPLLSRLKRLASSKHIAPLSGDNHSFLIRVTLFTEEMRSAASAFRLSRLSAVNTKKPPIRSNPLKMMQLLLSPDH